MAGKQTEVFQALNASAKELQRGIDRHCRLISSISDGSADDRSIAELLAMHPPESRETALKHAIRDAIDTLEATRKSFKSKQLEGLRKRLTDVLIGAD